MNQTWENGKKTSFGPKFGPQNFFHEFCLYYMLEIVASYHCIQFQEKLTSQNWKNGKNPSFGTNFGHFGPNLGTKIFLPLLHVRHCCKLSLYATSRKTNESHLRKCKKN